ncbi:Putative F-box protein At1g67623 [Linum perenne]
MASPPSISGGRHLFTTVPKDILIDVLARVAIQSSSDLVSVKLTCKALLDASSDDYIYRNVAISQFPIIPWKINLPALSFLHRCKSSGNPEALFRQGIIDFFSSLQIESGFNNLMLAARSGHLESIYVCGILALCQKQEEEGMALLLSLEGGGSRLPEIVRHCRNRVKSVRGIIWVRNFMVRELNPGRRNNCGCGGNGLGLAALATPPSAASEEGWTTREDEELEFYAANRCRSCFWDHEAASFCNMLKFGTFNS